MEVILSKLTQHAVNYAIRSGITITSGYAINQCSRLLKTVEGKERDEVASLKRRLENKIRIISPAINMIELIAARGNTSLDSAVSLTKSLRLGIQSLGARMARAADGELAANGSNIKNQAEAATELKGIVEDLKKLLDQIEDAVPLINLAISTSGVNLSTSLPSTVSPSRLLQASQFISLGDTQYAMNPEQPTQIGPSFQLSLYMLFGGYASLGKKQREMTWKEVIHKARVKLLRVPLAGLFSLPGQGISPPSLGASIASYHSGPIPSDGLAQEYAYQLLIVEDLDDDRVHDEEETKPGPFDGIMSAGIREIIPIHQVSKIFYADTGKILNIGDEGETNNPVLLLKRDMNAPAPRQKATEPEESEDEIQTSAVSDIVNVSDTSDDEDAAAHQLLRECSSHPPERTEPEPSTAAQTWKLPSDLDPEWMAFEIYTEDEDSDDDANSTADVESPRPPLPREDSLGAITTPFADLHVTSSPATPKSSTPAHLSRRQTAYPAIFSPQTVPASLPPLRTSLSLLELLIRLTALQQFQQCTHLSIEDELLNFFLSDSSSTGAGADAERRKMMRSAARRRVGFDPYAESPIKVRGEAYLAEHELEHGHEYEHGHASPGFEEGSWAETPGRRQESGRSSMVNSPSQRVRSEYGSVPHTPPGLPRRTEDLRRDVGKRMSGSRRVSASSLPGVDMKGK